MAEPGPLDAKVAYDAARKELVAALTKKRAIDKSLSALESQLYAFEGSYLTDTATSGGNIIQGFDNYLKATGGNKKRQEIGEADRIFSNSSYTNMRSLDIHNGRDSPSPSEVGGPVTLAVPAQSQDAYNRKDRKRGRREGTQGASGDEDEVIPTSRSRPNKRVRTNV